MDGTRQTLPSPFIIIRPSGLPFREEIYFLLNAKGFRPIEKIVVPNWKDLARKIYEDKFGGEMSGRLQEGAEAWLKGSELLFGAYAELVILEHSALEWNHDTAIELLSSLIDLKREYREQKRLAKELLRISCFQGGNEYKVFFDYIHCPDPDIDHLIREYKWIKVFITH